MNDTIVIGGQTDLDGHIDGEVNIKTEVAGECGIFFPVTPPPAPVEELVIKDVMFMDYDGSVVASYDAADFIANVTSLPTPPSHDGLTFQEWNWDIADIKTELQTGSGACCIGAHYTTNDGKSHFYINLTAQEQSKRVQMYIRRISGSQVVDWGDGTVETYTSNVAARHTYAAYGKYEITVDGGEWYITTSNWFLRSIPENNADLTGEFDAHTNTFLEGVRMGTNCKISIHSYNVFIMCPNLEYVCTHKDAFVDAGTAMNLSNLFSASGIKFFVFPKSLSSITSSNSTPLNNIFVQCPNLITVSYPKGFKYLLANPFTSSGIQFLYFPAMDNWDCKAAYCQFQYCFRLKRLAMKFNSFTTTYSNGFYALLMYSYNVEKVSWEKMCFTSPNRYTAYLCWNLQGEVKLPATVTELTGENFTQCRSVTKFTFLGDVKKIGVLSGNVFNQCYSCLEWDFTHCTTVPTLYATNCFGGIRPTAKIKVPAALEASWKTAANWSAYASYIVGV